MSRSIDRRVPLDLLPGAWGIARLAPEAPLPPWLADGPLTSVSRTADELSILCPETAIPGDVHAERGFACLVVRGPLAFTEVGILAALAAPLAAAGVSLFALSTFDTDYLLVRQGDLERAIDALEAAGHTVAVPPGARS